MSHMKIKFKPAARNEGQMTVQRNGGKVVPLIMNGKRVIGGELTAGQLYDVDTDSGEIRPARKGFK